MPAMRDGAQPLAVRSKRSHRAQAVVVIWKDV
jgi:hypothetical protein